VETAESHLRPDGTVWPPVTPEPPPPPGYHDPTEDEPLDPVPADEAVPGAAADEQA